ncbi:hypothetical protein [Enterovirga aerilata]|uniref:Uncharacterized protein n=1 Tax=Enterovirga aerilata TaxID=2730920 RepID=A0A849I5W4_9HYPH|nr:hypothetical protein [Enterovirga sp. DB1703]NNM74862.1 hypothetical protein [Enterovirga sp. DB1703]
MRKLVWSVILVAAGALVQPAAAQFGMSTSPLIGPAPNSAEAAPAGTAKKAAVPKRAKKKMRRR